MVMPTPSVSGIAHQAGTFKTLTDALDYAATGQTGVNFYGSDGSLVAPVTYKELRDHSIVMAGRLAAAFPRGSHIGLIAETSSDFLVAFMACQYAGMLPAPMSLPAAFGGLEAYKWQISRMAETASLRAVMSPAEFKELVRDVMQAQDVAVYDLNGSDLGEQSITPVPHTSDDPAYLQFSSGSTSDPKGIYATQHSVMANVHAITNEGLMITKDDRMASWLPFYHDMGIVGFFIVPMCNQCTLDYLSPTTFARRPGIWMRIISDNRCTITYSPSFGYGLAARRYRSDELDLSCLRVTGIGGDMIEHEVLEQFSKTFGPAGFNHTAFVASYGMAEVTLAASFAPLNTGPRLDAIKLKKLQKKAKAKPVGANTQKKRVFTTCGKPLPSLEVRILGKDGQPVAPRQVGRIMLRGDSLAAGYYRAEDGLKPYTDANDWFETGDLGYWLDEELVITGRSKDLMLWNGKNIWPQDLEWVAQKTGGKSVSRTAAFDVQDGDGTTRVMLLVECGVRDKDARAQIKREIVNAVRNVIGVPFELVFVVMRSLPVTSSGKLSRAGARVRYLDGELTSVPANKDDPIRPLLDSLSLSAQ